MRSEVKLKMEAEQTERLELRVSKPFLLSLDNWRRQKSPIPSRSEAIRQLTGAALKK